MLPNARKTQRSQATPSGYPWQRRAADHRDLAALLLYGDVRTTKWVSTPGGPGPTPTNALSIKLLGGVVFLASGVPADR
jgi:hypothetical protein